MFMRDRGITEQMERAAEQFRQQMVYNSVLTRFRWNAVIGAIESASHMKMLESVWERAACRRACRLWSYVVYLKSRCEYAEQWGVSARDRVALVRALRSMRNFTALSRSEVERQNRADQQAYMEMARRVFRSWRICCDNVHIDIHITMFAKDAWQLKMFEMFWFQLWVISNDQQKIEFAEAQWGARQKAWFLETLRRERQNLKLSSNEKSDAMWASRNRELVANALDQMRVYADSSSRQRHALGWAEESWVLQGIVGTLNSLTRYASARK